MSGSPSATSGFSSACNCEWLRPPAAPGATPSHHPLSTLASFGARVCEAVWRSVNSPRPQSARRPATTIAVRMSDTFGALGAARRRRRDALRSRGWTRRAIADVARLPYTLRVLLENVLRHGARDADDVRDRDVGAEGRALARDLLPAGTRPPPGLHRRSRDRRPRRHARRDARPRRRPGQGQPAHPGRARHRPLRPGGRVRARLAIRTNVERDYERNGERYAFLRWGQRGFDNFQVSPPNTGIVPPGEPRVPRARGRAARGERRRPAFPDTLVGTDSHTTMVNGLGVLGWGVGGIEAEAALLGEPVSMLVPQVVGFRLTGALPEGATATDLVLTVTEILRATGVVGKFVEFFGPGLVGLAARRPRDDRQHVARVRRHLRLLPGGRRDAHLPATDRAHAGADRAGRGVLPRPGPLPRADATRRRTRRSSSSTSATSSRASPGRGARRIAYRSTDAGLLPGRADAVRDPVRERLTRQGDADSFPASDPPADTAPGRRSTSRPGDEPVAVAEPAAPVSVQVTLDDGQTVRLEHGAVVIAAITSCTNTSNPSVMIAAGLVAKKAVERGLERKPWVKSSLAPGSQGRDRVLRASADLQRYLDALGFHMVGYGCTTCIGNSGPLPEPISKAVWRTTSSSPRCSPGTATSRRASTPR